jgi:hypothetical protein
MGRLAFQEDGGGSSAKAPAEVARATSSSRVRVPVRSRIAVK